MKAAIDEFGRLSGNNIKASCDYEGCTRPTTRDWMHQCYTETPGIGCRGWYCGTHILISRHGMICRACWNYHNMYNHIHEEDDILFRNKPNG